MKRLFKRSLAALLALVTAFGCLGMTAFADYTQAGDTPWKVEINTAAKTATVVGVFDKSYATMEIPATFYHRTENNEVTNYDITSVAANACAKDTVLRDLTVGKNVERINSGAFSECTRLSSVTFESDTIIHSGAFDKCEDLEEVYFSKPLNVSASAFAGCDKDLTFIYEIKDYYNNEEALEADLKLLGNGKWTKGVREDFYTWENKYAGYKVITSDTSIIKDTTGPDVSITVENTTWSSKTTASVDKPVCFDVDTLNAEIKFRDNGKYASGLKYLGYYLAAEPVTNATDLSKLPYTEIKMSELTEKDGWYIFNTKVNIGQKGVLYAIAEDVEGADGFANTPYLSIDQTAPTVSVINVTGNLNRNYTQILLGKTHKEVSNGIVYGMANHADKKDTDLVFSDTVKLKFDAKDDVSGIASIQYMVRYGNEGPNAAGYSGYTAMKKASDSWTELKSGDTITITGNSKTWCLVYVKVTDGVGRVAFGSSQYFKPGDGTKPVITAKYLVNGTETSVSLSDGAGINVSGAVKVTASDNSKIASFSYKEAKDSKATTISSASSGVSLKKDGVYTIVAKDDAKPANTTTVTITINNSGSAAPVATVTSVDNAGAEKKAEYKTNKVADNAFKSNYPVKVVITDDGQMNSISYVYVDTKNASSSFTVSDAAAKTGVNLSGYGKYTFTIKDNSYNETSFTVTITEPEHKITSAAIDTGNTANKTQLSCMGGSFKATLTGSNIYNKIALFCGDTMIGTPVVVGSAEKPMKTVDVASGTFKIPANTNKDKTAEYILRAYAYDAKTEDITSAKGTQLGKITVDAYKVDLKTDVTTLSYTAAGGTKNFVVTSNVLPKITASDSWITMGQYTVSTNNGVHTITMPVVIGKNTGFNRAGTITVSTDADSTKTVVIKIEQAGTGAADRLAGNNRIETSVAISKEGWTSAKNVVLANGLKFADALAGVPLAAAVDAPILLTENKSSGLEQSVVNEIKRLGANKVYVLGGTASVSDSIVTALKSAGYSVERIYGDNRYSTSVAIAEKLYTLTDKKFTKLYFANANNYPDALSISAAAAIEGNPILYVPTTGAAENYVSEFIKSSNCKTGVILGGTAAISEAGEKSLTKLGVSVTRISGSNRYETSVKINETYKSLFTGKSVAVATGESFPDALAGGALCAKLKMPVVLVSPKNYSSAVSFIKGSGADSLFIFGGTAVISDSLALTLAEAVE